MHTHLFNKPDEWECPNCDATDVTPPLPAGSTRYHTCPGLHSLSAPLVRKGTRVKVEANLREDYLNGDIQQTGDDGKVYMNTVVTRDEGTDCTVFAGLAHAEMKV